MRILCKRLAQQYPCVYHVPFSEVDNLFAKAILRGLDLRFLRFSDTVHLHLPRFATFIPTRYHALLMGMRCGVVEHCIPYFDKNLSFLTDLGVSTPSHSDYLRAVARIATNGGDVQQALIASGRLSLAQISERRNAVRSFLLKSLPDGTLR